MGKPHLFIVYPYVKLMKNAKYIYHIVLHHDSCWTRFTTEEYKDQLMSRSYNNGVLQAVRVVSYRKDLRRLFLNIRRNFDFNNISIIRHGSMQYYIMDMTLPSQGSTIHLFDKLKIQTLNASVHSGYETYDIFAVEQDYDHLYTSLKKEEDVRVVKMYRENLENETNKEIWGSNLTDTLLTPKEKMVVQCALRNGYFDKARKINLSELAIMMNLSKERVSSILKNAQKKVFGSLFSK